MSRYLTRDDISIGDVIYYNTTGTENEPISQIGRIVDKGIKYIWIEIKDEEGITAAYLTKLSKTPWYKLSNISKDKIKEYTNDTALIKDGINVDRYTKYTERYNRYNNYGRRYR